MTPNDFIPDSQFQADQPAQPETAAQSDQSAQSPPGFVPDSQFVSDQDKFGGIASQIGAGVEGVAQGLAGPVATGAEALLSQAGVPGLTPQDQAGRTAANPWTHGIGETAGFIGGALTGTGEAALLEHAGLALAPGAEALGKVGSMAARGAIEMGLLQGGDEISKRINDDPEQTVGSVVAHIGLSSLLGGAGGAALGAIFPKWITENQEPVEQGIQDLKNTISGSVPDPDANQPLQTISDNAPTASNLKSNDVAKVAARNNWPVMEGMTSDNTYVKQAEDALLNGPPTIPGIARRKLYDNALNAVTNDVDSAIASPSDLSETQVGQQMRDSLVQKLDQQYAPIKQMYAAIEPYQQAIPISDLSTGSLSRNIMKIADEQGLIPGTERYNFIKTFSDGIGDVDNLQKLANLRTEVNRSAGPLTKDLAGAINDKLDGVQDRAIGRFAQTMRTQDASNKILDVIDQAKQAKKGYAAYREQLQELGNNIGKKKIYGPQNFMDFVENMNPQTLTRRLFNESNTEFAQYFAKNFPEEMATMRQYQRAAIRQAAMKDGEFSAKKAIKSILDMEPETRSLLFTPEEMSKVQDAQKYLNSFPKSFNPSGTAHETAFRHFFESPTAAAVANIRDFGIQSFIKVLGRLSPGADSEAERLLPILGRSALDKDANGQAMKNSVEYLMSAIRGDQLLSRSARALFAGTLPDAISSVDEDRVSKLDKKLKDFNSDPDLASNVGGQMGHYLPNHDIAIKGAATSAAQYLNSLRPTETKGAPLDQNRSPSDIEKSNYTRALKIAENPLHVLALLKQGRMTSQDLGHLNALYPGFAAQMKQRVAEQMISHVAKEKDVPYQMRIGLSNLMRQPLDSSLAPQNILSNQTALAGPAQQESSPGRTKQKVPVSAMKDMARSGRTSLSLSDDGS